MDAGEGSVNVAFWVLVAAFDPGHSRFAECIGERGLKFQ